MNAPLALAGPAPRPLEGMIVTQGLRAGYGDGPDILHGIDLAVASGEIVTILGPNGCGKSTLLKTIGGFVVPRAGQVLIDARDTTSVPAHLRVREHHVGFVPQTDNVFATLSVAENILLGARFLVASQRRERLAQIMKAYPSLAAKKDRRASALSGGERQLLSIARALIADPAVLLLDEPSAGLSPLMMDEVFDEIVCIRDRTGMTILMVEQNAAQALAISDRAYVLALGRVAIEQRASELLNNPELAGLYLGAH
ncbi:ABC transporter ATP-binding protein [Ancylobacter sonchi]|uniref:ABC transporter ATP-binding protein n=1 Tax=Ancylobacter sonchi TaxID=1937790 RepID=UPI001FE31DEB|nr:ABC transporter ATP-binding protein [Ancylobacter sonchi]